jgi:DNA-binding MarR family transcriptional regulator
VGDEVQFMASASPSSSGSPVNGYFYNFGDGESTGWVADASVNHSFSGKGRFLVTLKARDADAAESASSAVTIDVFNFRPEVSIEPPAKGYAERPARLAANATDEDGTVVLYEWDFDGDGTVDLSGASMNAVIHIYPSDGIYKPILRVTDDNGSSSMASGSITVLPQPAAHPGSAPSIPLAVAAIMPLGILAAVGAFAATETGRYKLLALLFVPLFTRIKKEEVLDNYTRGLIHGFIIANPGDHYSAIKDALGLSNGNLAYHLKTLEREGIVQSRMDGMYRRFFPANEALLPRDGKYFSVQNRIVQQIRENPGISQKEISGKVGASRSTVNYHISVLATTRKIRVEKIDQWTRCFIYEERKN